MQPLGLAELRAMVSAIFDGARVGDEFASALLERTGGNAFFVEELMKVLLDRGDVYREGSEWARRDLAEIELPWTVRETLLARARSLSELELEVLKFAALAGDPFDLSVLARATGMGVPAIEAVVERGLQLQLVTEGAEAGDVEKAVEFGTLAARGAVASYAFDEPGRHYEQVLKLAPGSVAKRLDLLLEAAEALREGPDSRLVASFASEARDLVRARSEPVGVRPGP